MTNLIVLSVYCQLRLSVSIGELKSWKEEKIENTLLDKYVLKNSKLIFHPNILIIGMLRAILKHQRLVPMYFFLF